MDKIENNPERYSRMCVPFEKRDDADAAIDAFCEGVQKLREEHRIKDVSIVFEMNMLTADGSEGGLSGSMHLGNMAQAESMLALAYGRERKRREELMMRLTKGKVE